MGDGATLRTHLQRDAKNGNTPDPRLNIEWPRAGQAIWDAFRRMGRSVTMGGAGPILPENILAYQQLHGVRFTAWELEVIEALDAVALEAMREQQDKKT
nr:hypothetical protein [uncultured Massilia sp.]